MAHTKGLGANDYYPSSNPIQGAISISIIVFTIGCLYTSLMKNNNDGF